jgi:GWxTD domain-containing protein
MRLGVVCLIGGFLLGSSGQPRSLPPYYATWLDEDVAYIISQKERDVFLNLEGDQERNLFIEAFWKQRDPVPVTDDNEFKAEHYRRLRYAKENFGKTSSRPGWATDRGKIYIILGPPMTIDSYGSLDYNLVPIEVWTYQGDFGGSLPSMFYVVFFRDGGVGDFILYSPLRHGPKKLLDAYDADPNRAMQILQFVSFELARVSQSLIPGETSALGAAPSLASENLLNKIRAFPLAKVNSLWAEKLLRYRSIVETDHSVRYIESRGVLAVVPETGFSLVHFAIEPKTLNIGSIDKRYFIQLEVYGRVSDREGRTIYQHQKSVHLDVDPSQVGEMTSRPFSFRDCFPLVPGDYQFDLLIKNSISKEFASLEWHLQSPDSSSEPIILPIILSPRMERNTEENSRGRPFQFGPYQLYPQSQNIFTPSEMMWVCFGLQGDCPWRDGSRAELTFEKEGRKIAVFRKKLREFENQKYFLEGLSLQGLAPGFYNLVVSVASEDGSIYLTQREGFQISSATSVPRIWSLAEAGSAPADAGFFFALGTQHFQKNQLNEAAKFLEKAYAQEPGSLEFALGLAELSLRIRDYERTNLILTRFLVNAGQEPRLYAFLGKANAALGENGKAIYYFKKYLNRFGTNLEILNELAECCFLSGDRGQARTIWEKSLELDPRQNGVRDKLKLLKESNTQPNRKRP